MILPRRAVLRAGGLLSVGALAGCSDTVRPPRADDPDGDSGTETRPRGTGGPGLSIAAVDSLPPLPVRPEVAVTRDTADHPPQLRVTVTNESDEAVRIGEGREVVFAYVADTGRQLILLPTGDDYPAEPDCWRLTEPVAVTEEYQIVDLAPGESTAQLVDLYGAPGPDACLPVGTFRFESNYAVTTDTDTAPETGDRATWGFSVSLE